MWYIVACFQYCSIERIAYIIDTCNIFRHFIVLGPSLDSIVHQVLTYFRRAAICQQPFQTIDSTYLLFIVQRRNIVAFIVNIYVCLLMLSKTFESVQLFISFSSLPLILVGDCRLGHSYDKDAISEKLAKIFVRRKKLEIRNPKVFCPV